MANPRGNPNWKKGESGNPGGRPKDSLGEYLRSLKGLPREIYKVVHPLLFSSDPNIVLKAAEFLSDRRDGKPNLAVTVSGLFDILEQDREKFS